ncbi:MAG: nucleoside deaminase [Actinobacteria bacterium]|nr:nucleoside deaminase [Actinomycetota bacterium]
MKPVDQFSAAQTLDSLSEPWTQALDEAWLSWQHGNFGIGAVLFDPHTKVVTGRGRNAIGGDPSSELRLRGNWMAHAEMNLFASMSAFNARGLHLYTTLEPCLMCAATAIFLDVEEIKFGANDEYFHDLDSLWKHHPYTASRQPSSTKALSGKLSSFCRLLPLSFTFEWRPGTTMVEEAIRHRPVLAKLAESGVATTLRNVGLGEALDELWPELPDDEVHESG